MQVVKSHCNTTIPFLAKALMVIVALKIGNLRNFFSLDIEDGITIVKIIRIKP